MHIASEKLLLGKKHKFCEEPKLSESQVAVLEMFLFGMLLRNFKIKVDCREITFFLASINLSNVNLSS